MSNVLDYRTPQPPRRRVTRLVLCASVLITIVIAVGLVTVLRIQAAKAQALAQAAAARSPSVGPVQSAAKSP